MFTFPIVLCHKTGSLLKLRDMNFIFSQFESIKSVCKSTALTTARIQFDYRHVLSYRHIANSTQRKSTTPNFGFDSELLYSNLIESSKERRYQCLQLWTDKSFYSNVRKLLTSLLNTEWAGFDIVNSDFQFLKAYSQREPI